MTLPRWVRAAAHVGRVGELTRCVRRVKNWRAVARRYLGLGGSYPLPFVTRFGHRLELMTHHDLVTAWVIFCRREYRVPPQARLIVDLGANIGAFSFHAVEAAPSALIVAAEPFPSTFDRLVSHVTANGLTARVVCRRAAVGIRAGVRRMSAEGPSQSRGLLPEESPAGDSRIEVAVHTLGQILDDARRAAPGRGIDFLKIDVEGAEHEFVHGLPDGSLADVHEVGMEYHPNGDKAALFAALAGHGLIPVRDCVFGPNVGVAHFRRRG